MAANQSNIAIAIVKGKINHNLKIVVQMSELSQMIELANPRKIEMPNLATFHRLACRGSYSSINCKELLETLPNAAIY